MTLRTAVLSALAASSIGAAGLSGQAREPVGDPPATPAPYAPYEFLVGEWDVAVVGSPPAAVTRFRWGPMKTYLWFSGSLLVPGDEQPTYEGILVWNGVRKNLDMLVVLDLATGGLVREHGEVFVEPDGTVVRDITVVYSEGEALPPTWDRAAGPEGATARFRHSFERVGPDEIRSAVLRDSAGGWVPSFPGSDRLVLTRRAG